MVNLRTKWALFMASLAVAMTGVAGTAFATETETEKGVGKVAEKVGSEGVSIVLIVLAALTALIVAIIVIPKAIGIVKRFV